MKRVNESSAESKSLGRIELRHSGMFTDVPVLGLIFATLFCESCATVGAALTVGAWLGNVETDGLIVGLLFCAAAVGCGVAAWRAGSRMDGKWAGGIAAASTVLLWVIVVHAKGALL
jgi:hypothetical protein